MKKPNLSRTLHRGLAMILAFALLLGMLPAAVQAVFQYPMLVYAIVLIVVIMFRPRGIFGSYEFSLINLKKDLKAALERRAAAKAERKEAKSNG